MVTTRPACYGGWPSGRRRQGTDICSREQLPGEVQAVGIGRTKQQTRGARRHHPHDLFVNWSEKYGAELFAHAGQRHRIDKRTGSSSKHIEQRRRLRPDLANPICGGNVNYGTRRQVGTHFHRAILAGGKLESDFIHHAGISSGSVWLSPPK
jgi:hypothetical protein